jgi:ABC-type dipeptide/oligopeptide/nickel transport system permease component
LYKYDHDVCVKGQQVNQYNTSFSHYFVPVFTNFLVVLVVFVTLSRKASGLTLRDKFHNFARTYFAVSSITCM